MSEQLSSRVLVAGHGAGEVLVLDESLSLWGGLDPESGRIIDPRHPQYGELVTGRVLVLPFGRGSSSASSILLEAMRLETAPAGLVLRETDGILALGAAVAREMYGRSLPVLVLGESDYAGLRTGMRLQISADGTIAVDAAVDS